jgi:uncharacterized RDD family membrane protein YckC
MHVMEHERADVTHEVERVDVSVLSETQRDMLWMRLRRDDVAYVFDGDHVTVSDSNAPLLVEALAWVNSEVRSPPQGFYERPRPFRRTLDDGSVIASRWRRIAGAYVDSIVIGVPFATAHRLGLSSWALFPLSALYVIGMTGRWGRTVGKLATGTKVVSVVGRPRLTWRQSGARWVEVGWIGIAAGLVGGDAALLLFLLQAVVYAPVLWDPLGRGLHDRLADTIVIKAAGNGDAETAMLGR